MELYFWLIFCWSFGLIWFVWVESINDDLDIIFSGYFVGVLERVKVDLKELLFWDFGCFDLDNVEKYLINEEDGF